MIIDNTFFHGKIMIPNSNDNGIGGKSNNINRLIEDECYAFLNSLLGNEVYTDLTTYFDSNLNLLPTAPQKYLDLFNGVNYGDNKVWSGLVIKKKLGNYSLLADWVWIRWFEDSISLNSNNGQIALEPKNATRINPTEKYVEVWNDLVKKVVGVSYNSRPTVYYKGCIKFTDWYGGCNNGSVSLLDYLSDHSTDFPNVSLTTPNNEPLIIKNIFGL